MSQTHSLNSKGYKHLFRSIKNRGSRYSDISASDETFRLCVVVGPAGKYFAITFSCSFNKKTASAHVTKKFRLYEYPLLLWKTISIIYCDCVFVDFGIQHAKLMRRIIE